MRGGFEIEGLKSTVLDALVTLCVCVCVCVCLCVCAGKPVLVVNGAYRGTRAILEALDTANFCVSVRIDQVKSLKEGFPQSPDQ